MTPVISVENVVATAAVGRRLDLGNIDKLMDQAQYDPGSFPGLVLRTKKPKACVLLFASGKAVCTGSKSVEQAGKAVGTVVGLLRSHGVEIDGEPTIEVQNMVACTNLGQPVKLEDAAVALPRSMYEPEMFPGMTYRILDPKVTILLFASGKLVCTGAKTMGAITRAVGHVSGMLENLGLFGMATKPAGAQAARAE